MDSWGWIKLANTGEPHHDLVTQFYQEEVSTSKIITTDYIFNEVVSFLFNKIPMVLAEKFLKGLWASMEIGNIRLERISKDRFESAWKMRVKYHDHADISFTDFTSFVVMKELKLKRVLTNDHHFEQLNLGFMRVPNLQSD